MSEKFPFMLGSAKIADMYERLMSEMFVFNSRVTQDLQRVWSITSEDFQIPMFYTAIEDGIASVNVISAEEAITVKFD